MKNTLYYENAYTTTFDATIQTEQRDDNGLYVTLSNTAFYPEGGGQPADIGTLNHVDVIDVQKVDGEIRHYISQEIGSTNVKGQIDWATRFDHMQQHNGQHILTAAFVELFGYETVSFHLGKETVTIDLQTSHITEEQLKAAEQRANAIILENLPIETKWVTAEEAKAYPLRKALTVDEDVRLVIIPNIDYNGCGGLHPRRTGEVQMIKLLTTEKAKKNIRLHFICGQRVNKKFSDRSLELEASARLLNRPEHEVASAIQHLLTQQKQYEKTIQQYEEKALAEHIEQLIQRPSLAVRHIFDGYSMQQLQKIARTITEQAPEKIVFLASYRDDKIQIVCAKGKISSSTQSMKECLQMLLPAINGRGGGNEMFAQGGGEALLSTAALREKLECLS